MKKWLLCVVIGLLVWSVVGSASGANSEDSDFFLEDIVVTATRYEEDVSTVPANITVISEEDIKSSTAKDVPSILRTQVGAHVSDLTGNRRSYRVDLRGFGATAQSNMLVLVDGRRINQADLSGTDWTLIPLDRIKRIEIIRGGRGGVLYGDNASGGVINIITKEGKEFEVGIEGAAGSYDTTSISAYANGAHGNLSYALSGRLYDSDGYRSNSDMYSEDIGLNLGYLFGDRGSVSLSAGLHKDETGLPGALKESELESGIGRSDTVHPDDFANMDDYYLKLKPEVFFFEDGLFQLDLSYRQRDSLSFSSFIGGTYTGDTEIETVIASPQFIFKVAFFGFDNNLTFGYDYVKTKENIINELSLSGFPSSTDSFKLQKVTHGYYIHDQFYPLSSLAFSVGYRYDEVEYTFFPSDPDHADFDESLVTAGVNYEFYEKSYAYLSFSQSFRYPVLDELFSFFSNTIDPTLAPQTSDDYEFGIRHYFTDTLYANSNFFRIDTKDEIFYNPTGGPFGWGANENLDGEARREGVEISLENDFENLTLRGSFTYVDTEIVGGQYSGKAVPGVPKHKATFDVVFYPIRNLTMALNGIYVGERFFENDFANAFSKQEDHIVINAKLKYGWENLTVYLDVNNLLDEEYSEYGVLSSGVVEKAIYPSPGINFFFGLRYDY